MRTWIIVILVGIFLPSVWIQQQRIGELEREVASLKARQAEAARQATAFGAGVTRDMDTLNKMAPDWTHSPHLLEDHKQ